MNLENIPNLPGCYLFLNSKGKIIYIGKAKNLKKRVSSYFNKKDLDSKTKALVSHIKDIDFIVTQGEVEALLLENNLIKKNNPKYNINLKDSKSYSYIELTKEEFPRFITSRSDDVNKTSKKKTLYGPFVSGQKRDYILDLVNKNFKIRTCKTLPKKKCIRYDLGICSAPCINKISKQDYMEDVESAKMILSGKMNELMKRLKKEMSSSSKSQNYEKAMKKRDQILALEYLKEKQRVERNKVYNEDIINYIVNKDKVHIMVFNVNKGLLENKQYFEIEYSEEFLDEFLMRFYENNKIPKKVILPKVNKVMQEYLTKVKKSKVEIVKPVKGELKELLDLVEKNIEVALFGNLNMLKELQNKLKLEYLPEVIECFDISHLSGTQVVASMVSFYQGKPDKKNYRKFKIRAQDKNDDFAAMREVVFRRYSRLKKEKKRFPDLIVIDGGIGQLNSAKQSLEEVGVKIPIISLAKREEEIYLSNEEILQLGEKNKARKLLESIRNEAHRFAVNYQRERRRKDYFKD